MGLRLSKRRAKGCSEAKVAPDEAKPAPERGPAREPVELDELDAYVDELLAAWVAPTPLAAATPSRPAVGRSPAPAAVPDDEEALLRTATKGEDFSFRGRRFLAKVVDFYDGDTVRVVFVHNGERVQYRARMAGYDSPELRPPKKSPCRRQEIAAAIAAREALRAKVGDELAWVECGAFDKYGRLLVTLRKRAGPRGAERGEDVNAWMVANGHGVPYDGGTKKPFAPGEAGGG